MASVFLTGGDKLKKIVFITISLGFGGAEKMLTYVANQLTLRGHSCSIININSADNYVNVKQQKLEKSIKIYSLKQTHSKNKNFHRILQIYKIVKDIKADIILGFTVYPNMYAKIVGTMLGVPSLMSERADPYRTADHSIKDKIMMLLINTSKGGVFQTDGAMKFYTKGLRKRGKIIPNPIFINDELPKVDFLAREKTVVSVGRLDNEQKRYDVMLKAFQIFSKKHPEYILKLYGKGSDEELIETWVKELKIIDKVKFMGLSLQPMKDISKDGMFIITSDYEGISNALLEAMAVGLPCVSTDHTPGGARLLIKDHENGLLAPIGDVENLAKCLCEYAENPELAKKCGENAEKVVETYEPQKIIDMWEEYILKCCK